MAFAGLKKQFNKANQVSLQQIMNYMIVIQLLYGDKGF